MTKVQIHDAITGKTTIREATTQEQKEFDDLMFKYFLEDDTHKNNDKVFA